MKMIAIDPASQTGWAVRGDGEGGTFAGETHGSADVRPAKPKAATKRNPTGLPGEPDGIRWLKLWQLLERLAQCDRCEGLVFPPDGLCGGCADGRSKGIRLVHEGPLEHHAGARAARLAFGAWAVICAWCGVRGVPRVEVGPLDLQRFVLGRRATPKSYEVLQAAKDRLGYQGNDDNEADAMWLLRFAEAQAAEWGGKS